MPDPAAITTMFSGIARRYDAANDLLSGGLHRLWKRRLVRAAQPGPGRRLLDAATGTGDVALALARAGADVVGVDLTKPMLDIARARGAQEPGLHLTWREGDLSQLPDPDGTYDAITAAFGIRNVANPPVALAELWRVLKPGGRLLVLEFGGWQTGPLPVRVFHRLASAFIPTIGGAVTGKPDAYRYLFQSSTAFPAGQAFLPWLHALPGAEGVRAVPHVWGVAWRYEAQRAASGSGAG